QQRYYASSFVLPCKYYPTDCYTRGVASAPIDGEFRTTSIRDDWGRSCGQRRIAIRDNGAPARTQRGHVHLRLRDGTGKIRRQPNTAGRTGGRRSVPGECPLAQTTS